MGKKRRKRVKPVEAPPVDLEFEAPPPGPDAEEPVGLECLGCGCSHFEVVSTRRAAAGRIIRRRACRYCGRRVTTTEGERGTPDA